MKRITSLLFCCCTLTAGAQNYPLDVGFSNVLSGQLPAGWSGDMVVTNYHGLNDDKGLAGLISGGDKEDSVVTDWVGPLDDYIQIIFWYRLVEDFIYPSTPKNLTTDKLILYMSENGVNYNPIYTIDSTNHLPSLNFKKIDFNLSGQQGKTVKFKFWARHGKGSTYFVDIDSIKVRKDIPPPSVTYALSGDSYGLYPNPVKYGEELHIDFGRYIHQQSLVVYNLVGEKVAEWNLSGYKASLQLWLSPGIYFITDGLSRQKIIVR